MAAASFTCSTGASTQPAAPIAMALTPPTACHNSSITQFAVGGNGSLTFQETFNTQGLNPFRIITDGINLLVLDRCR